jgi:hypothetical protein
MAALCEQLTEAAVRYSGTDLILRYDARPLKPQLQQHQGDQPPSTS